jgi:hypothetical protein
MISKRHKISYCTHDQIAKENMTKTLKECIGRTPCQMYNIKKETMNNHSTLESQLVSSLVKNRKKKE